MNLHPSPWISYVAFWGALAVLLIDGLGLPPGPVMFTILGFNALLFLDRVLRVVIQIVRYRRQTRRIRQYL